MRSKSAVKNIISSLILQFVAIVCGFIIPKLIMKTFGSDVNGLVTSITQFLAYITLLESGIGPVIKSKLYKPIAEKNQTEIENILASSERFFKFLTSLFLLYIVLLCFFYPFIVAKDFQYIFTVSLLIIISISTIFEYYFGMTYRLFLQASQKTYIASYFQVATTVFNAIAIVVLILCGFNILIVKLVSSFIFVLRPLLQNYYVKKKYNINLKNADKKYKLEQKWDGLAQHIAAVVHSNTDIVILTIFMGVIEVSVYSVYNLVITGIKRVVEALIGGIDASFGDMLAQKELDHLNKSFSTYELFYYSLITIVFVCTLQLIIPFVSVYTRGITDANYIRPFFAVLFVLAEYAHSIRLPYSSIILAAGHFKETRRGAWVEAGLNLILSIVLVFKFGIIGVGIGTLVAMIVRTFEFVYHTDKYILQRNSWMSIKKIIITVFETLVLIVIFRIIPNYQVVGYTSWFIYSMIVFLITTFVVILTNIIVYRNEFTDLKLLVKRVINR